MINTITKNKHQYSLRTCSRCGIKKPSNRIYSKTVEKSFSGQSRRSINIFTWFGFLLRDKGSLRAIKQYLFQSSNRKYSANSLKDINLCSKCYHFVPAPKKGGILKVIFFPFFLIFTPVKFIFTSPIIREFLIYGIGVLIFLGIKLLKSLRIIGIKILDQDGDGDIDSKDFEIAYQKTASFFSKFKRKEAPKK